MSVLGHLRHFERPLGMSVMPPIATENGEALNARGETARYTSEGIVLCRQRAVLFLRDFPNDFSAWGSFSRSGQNCSDCLFRLAHMPP